MGWEGVIGLGVAGNFAGHLEQAGEADDFKELEIADAAAPKGVFPFYVPGGGEHFLHTCPISAERIRLSSDPGVDPEGPSSARSPAEAERHQIEPEVSLLCDVLYAGERVSGITPRFAMAHNDCSIRRPGARKISEKKNWGRETKGTSDQRIPIDRFEPGGVLDGYRIASFLQRGDALTEYGVDSPVASYSYMYGRLVDWLVEKLNEQRDEGPLEDISEWIRIAGRPSHALVSIGATRYTPFGESTFLERGDRAIVAVYDAARFDAATIRAIAAGEREAPEDGLSLLRQEVV